MKEYQSLSHTRWDCKYHIVFIPKYRKKLIYGALRKHLGEIFRELAKQRECSIVEGHLMIDHVHMCLSVPPKYSVSNVVGFMIRAFSVRANDRRRKTTNPQHYQTALLVHPGLPKNCDARCKATAILPIS